MITILEQYRAIYYADKRTIEEKAESSKISKTTIYEIIHGVQDNPRLQTFLSLLEDAGAELVIKTEQSEQAIADQDVAYYRKQVSDLLLVQDRFLMEIERKEAQLEQLEESIKFYRDAVKEKDKKISDMIDHIMKHDS